MVRATAINASRALKSLIPLYQNLYPFTQVVPKAYTFPYSSSYDLHILSSLLFLSDLRKMFSIHCGVIALKSIAKH